MGLFFRLLVVSVVLGLAIAPTGCASERDPVNRVQSAALAKSFFVGEKLADPVDDPEFYMHTTVVDVPAGADSEGLFTSSDAQPTVRIKWEITEKSLLARLTYERVADTDHKGLRPTPNGQVVAAYDIEKHFDIRREYNTVTGEEMNVVVENDTDRPWYDRTFFRVDWSKNSITNAYELDTVSALGLEGAVTFQALSYYVDDPKSPDAPVFDLEHGYLDITNKVFASPQVVHDPDYGDVPACYLTGNYPVANCNPSEIVLRQAFLKVVDHDYEVLDYDGNRMDLFGWFSNDRLGYDRRYGVIDDKWHRFASKWNVYEKSHASPIVTCASPESTAVGKNPHRDDDHDGTEDECQSVGRGSRCDVFRGECTLPLRDRKVKTTVWYVNPGFPEDLFDGTSKTLDGWSEAIRVAIVAGRLAECRRTKDASCNAEMGWPARWADDFSPPVGAGSPAEVARIFVLCHNPVDPKKDDAACGPAADKANVPIVRRLGDLRYNFINLVDSPQLMSPWGIMVDAEDPLTGEKIAGSVNQWGSVLDRAAATLVDLLGLLNGELAPTDYIEGQNVTSWVAANRPGGTGEGFGAMDATEAASRAAAFDPQVIAPYLGGLAAAKKAGVSHAPPTLRRKNRLQALLDSNRLGPGNGVLGARLAQLRNTPIEAAMVSPSMAQAAGFDPSSPITKDAINRGSPFGKMNPTLRRERDRNKRLSRSTRHSCKLDAPEADNLIGLARYAAKLFPKPDPKDPAAVATHKDAVYNWARREYSNGVFAHEMGHSMGLRHNFAASFDSLNYSPQYWQLRTKNGQVTTPCADGNTDGSACVGPRWRDPLTPEETDGNIGKFGTTSVMDYPGDQNHDMDLQGKYDKAAIRFGYGGVVDVWDGNGLSVKGSGDGKKKAYELTAFTQGTGLFGIVDMPTVDPASGPTHLHYSGYQSEFGLLGDCTASSSPNAVLGKTCNEHAMDVVSYDDMLDFAADPDWASFSFGITPRAVDATGRVRRGYMFMSDEYSDSGNVPAFTYDAGADAYEQIRFLESAYENRYIVDAFRHNRVTFNSEAVVARMQTHYLDTIQLISKTYAFGMVLDADDPSVPPKELLADGNWGPLGMGSTIAFDMYARILTRPEPGYYCNANADTCVGGQPYGLDLDLYVADSAPLPAASPYDFHLPLGAGRFVHNDFDYGKGYWWGDYQKQVGAYYEKIWATYYLAEAFDSFISNSKEDFVDGRYKNVNFATVYPAQTRRLFASLFTGDASQYGPWVDGSGAPGNNPADSPITYPSWHALTAAGLGKRATSAKLLDANWGFNEQLYAMVWSTMYFPTNWSQSYVDDARITTLAADQINWPANETYTFYDPASGKTYRAHSTGLETIFGVDHEKSIGARMLEWATTLLIQTYLVETDAQGYILLNANGTVKLKLDANGRPQKDPQTPGADAQLQKYMDQVDIFRQLTASFSQSLGDADLPHP
jgi:hypothetical protein